MGELTSARSDDECNRDVSPVDCGELDRGHVHHLSISAIAAFVRGSLCFACSASRRF